MQKAYKRDLFSVSLFKKHGFSVLFDFCRGIMSLILLWQSEPPHCHSELVEESPTSTTNFVSEITLSYNLLVSANALLLSFQILQSFHSLRIKVGSRYHSEHSEKPYFSFSSIA